MEKSNHSIDDVDPPIPPAKDGSVDENRLVDGKTKSRSGKKDTGHKNIYVRL